MLGVVMLEMGFGRAVVVGPKIPVAAEAIGRELVRSG
jgi:hypothetical protein